ncbi:MAG TPA: CpsD/CapB family tyrosine-protein kinase [Steroidobacteraceae bacterium]|jgi:protein-tyrosine kinase|nr:CpsD/CapB family tyrosine-protein kinase [Steroidobacteraceae bacterium]
MSIIEEAVRKNAERQNRQAATDPPRGQARLRRVPTAPVDTSHAQRFQPVTLDKAVLHDNFVLPQLQDAGALRAYKILRTRVLRRLEANQWRSFALTGVTAGEGKTLTAINLAIALAQDVNTWVALVDLDLQRPRVAEYLGLRSTHGEKGLSDYLQGDATFENIVYAPSDIERLAIIPNFTPLLNASETLTSPRMGELMQALEAETPRRILIFDMPPVLAADDVLAFAPQIDGLLLVVAEGTTDRNQLTRAKEVLAEMNLLGVVLNRSAERNDAAYYSYSYANRQ